MDNISASMDSSDRPPIVGPFVEVELSPRPQGGVEQVEILTHPQEGLNNDMDSNNSVINFVPYIQIFTKFRKCVAFQ